MKNYSEFINESNGTDIRYDMMKKLKKLMGARNVNSVINYKDSDRGRIQTNWDMFNSLYVQQASKDYSLIDKHNFDYIFDKIERHNINQNQHDVEFIKHLVETYKPTYEQIEGLFERIADKKVTPLIEYLASMIKEDKIGAMVNKILPSGLGYTGGYANRASLYHELGYYKFEGETGSEKMKWPRKVSQTTLVKFINYRSLKEIAYKVINKDDFDFNLDFFEAIVQHPNNGGINVNNSFFKRFIEDLSKIDSFKYYIYVNSSKIFNIKMRSGESLRDYLPEEMLKNGTIKYKL